MQRVLITGASRGLGLEFARRYLQRGDRVFAGCRAPSTARELQHLRPADPDRLTIVEMDVAVPDSIRAGQALVRSRTDALDLLINNAGIYSPRGSEEPTEQLGDLNCEDALIVLRVNAVAPLIVAQEYWDLLRSGTNPKVVSITSGYGSISANTDGFPYYYSASKAALNMLMRTLAADGRRWGITSVVLDPGWVSTDMGGPDAPVTPVEAVDAMIKVIDRLKPRHNGSFLDWQGTEQAW